MGQLRDQLSRTAPTRAGLRDASRGSARAASGTALVRRGALLALVGAALVSAVVDGGAVAAVRDATPVARVTGGAPTLDALVERFLAALRAGDRAALEALRLTKDEYVHLVMPGHVAPGEPPQRLSPEAAEYFFDVMDGKSAYFREALVARHAGRNLRLRSVTFDKGIADYAGHRSYKRAVLVLEDEDGRELELRTGSVVERDGRFKFASFIRD